MRTPKILQLVDDTDHPFEVHVLVDIEKLHTHLMSILRTMLRFDSFTELEGLINSAEFPRSIIEIATPELIQEQLFFGVKFSSMSSSPLRDKDLYVRWMYQTYGGDRYYSKDYQNIKQVIETNKLLTG